MVVVVMASDQSADLEEETGHNKSALTDVAVPWEAGRQMR
jgi:hypothetical protein